MKERENREFWIRQTVLLAMLSIDILIFFILLLQDFFGFGRIWISPEPKRSKGRLSPCPDPTRPDMSGETRVYVLHKLLPGGGPWTP